MAVSSMWHIHGGKGKEEESEFQSICFRFWTGMCGCSGIEFSIVGQLSRFLDCPSLLCFIQEQGQSQTNIWSFLKYNLILAMNYGGFSLGIWAYATYIMASV